MALPLNPTPNPDYWTVQVFDEKDNDWNDYFKNTPTISEKNGRTMISLYGNYFGSSTRMGELGTLFNLVDNQISNFQTKYIRIHDNKGKILKQFKITPENEIISGFGYEIMVKDDIRVVIRDLHRYDGHPCEIASVCFFMD